MNTLQIRESLDKIGLMARLWSNPNVELDESEEVVISLIIEENCEVISDALNAMEERKRLTPEAETIELEDLQGQRRQP